MPDPNIKSTHKPIKTYYAELEKYAQLGEENEGTVRAAFQNLLQHYCHQSNFTLLCEKTHALPADTEVSGQTLLNRRIRLDGEVVDAFGLPSGQEIRSRLPIKQHRRSIPDAHVPLSTRTITTQSRYHRAEKPRPYAPDVPCVYGRRRRGK